MDSSGRTTERQYDVGGGRLNTNCATLRGVAGKWDSQVYPLEVHRMERKQELLLVSCKVEEEENKATPNTRWKSSPGWERPFWSGPYRAQAGKTVLNCWPSGHPHSMDDNSRGPQSTGAEDAHCAGDAERPKRSGHCALSIKEKPVHQNAECRSRKAA